ncbi:MAG: hypothetical protein WKF47_19820 [Geodermatophilaceae bacterium]
MTGLDPAPGDFDADQAYDVFAGSEGPGPQTAVQHRADRSASVSSSSRPRMSTLHPLRDQATRSSTSRAAMAFPRAAAIRSPSGVVLARTSRPSSR